MSYRPLVTNKKSMAKSYILTEFGTNQAEDLSVRTPKAL